MDDLIAELEAAESGSRELSEKIYYLIAEPSAATFLTAGEPAFSESVDAALTLVPETHQIRTIVANGFQFGVDDAKPTLWRATLQPRKRVFGEIDGSNVHSMILAICIAALKAREAERKKAAAPKDGREDER